MKKLVLILAVGVLSLSSCEKVTACLEADVITAKLGQTVTITNCSENQEESVLDAKDGEGSNDIGANSTAIYHTVGTFTATIVSTKKDNSETAETTITIENPTDVELVGTWNLNKTTHNVAGIEISYSDSDVMTFNADGTGSGGDWSIGDNAELTIGSSEDLSIYTLYNNELIVKEYEDEVSFYLYHFTKE